MALILCLEHPTKMNLYHAPPSPGEVLTASSELTSQASGKNIRKLNCPVVLPAHSSKTFSLVGTQGHRSAHPYTLD